MNQSLSFSEMNHAVPGSLGSPPSYMESNSMRECLVPSPSQWSDPSRSPPSLHSPAHFPNFDFEPKLKEEPFSPRPVTKPLNQFSSVETSSSSINLAELLEENRILTTQNQAIRASHEVQNTGMVQNYSFDFLDLLVDVKKEKNTDDVLDMVGMGMTPPVSPQAPQQTYVPAGDVLKTVERMALEHFRQDLQRVSDKLGIPKDPSCWTLEDSKSWLSFQACQLDIPPPHLDYWRFAGSEMIKLTEANFRELIPQGGELLYAKLEIWREALRTTYELQLNSQYLQQIQNVQPSNGTLSNMQYTQINNRENQNISSSCDFILQQHQQQQVYMTPPRVSCFPSPGLVSPQSPLQINISSPGMISSQCSPVQVQSPSSSSGQFSSVQSPSSSVPSPPMTPQQVQHVQQSSPSPAPNIAQINSSYLFDEACMDMASFLRQGEESFNGGCSPKPTPSVDTSALKKEVQESEEDVDEPTTVTRGGTHIHLWQFLKELLQQPQQYGTCIRWLERSKGVFKIEDSVRVAKVWGKRKNRPAMNYDKLSRSIRQYYKKGIMKKTERSQRLVYQFCHPYCL